MAQHPDVAFYDSTHWVLGNVSQWQHWPLAADTLAALQTQAQQWQQKFPEALIVGGISYEQAALHHGYSIAHGEGLPGAFLGLVLPEHIQRSATLAAPKVPFTLPKAFAPRLSEAQFTAQLSQLIALLRQYPQQQANLAQPFVAEGPKDAASLWQAWLTLMAHHAAPHACFVHTEQISLLSASPELLLKATPHTLQAEPIKGSRPRGSTTAEDEALAQALLHSTKDLAENRMITALQAEEISPLCVAGSVRVVKDCELRRFSNVQHLVSTVVGTPTSGLTSLEALIACMPGASITGTPKAWAINTIAQLEANPRGFYCGSFFYLQHHKLVANVLIRTVQAAQGTLVCHGGGGITALSNSQEEYRESCFKVAPLLDVWAP